eukprot:3733754-Alexandrium_andersonii.AAC.1
MAERATADAIGKQRAARKEILGGKGGLGAAYRALRDAPTPPVAFLESGQGLATTPDQLTTVMREAWTPIYNGR